MTPRRIAAGAVVVSLLAGLVGWLVGRTVESPADAALDATAPASGPITVPVERRVLSADLRVRGTLGAVDSTEVTLAPSEIGSTDTVVVRAPAQGDPVAEGDVIMEVGNRPVIALGGDLPMYRDLGPGDLGDDVLLVESALARLNYFEGAPNDTWDDATSAAVQRLYDDRGFTPVAASPELTQEIAQLNAEADAAAKGGDAQALAEAEAALGSARAKAAARLPANEVVLVPRLPARVAKVAVRRGSTIDGAVMTLASEVPQIRSSVAEVDRKLVKPDQTATAELTDSGERFDATVVSVADEPGTGGAGPERYAVTLSPKDPPANSFGADVTLTLRVRSTDDPVLVVPAAALSLAGDGTTRVTVLDGDSTASVEVEPGLTAGGLVELTPTKKGSLVEGDEVVVGTADGEPLPDTSTSTSSTDERGAGPDGS
ncbi:MAG: hypothetical protein R2754_09285 [Microthrixaceae bacterium]